MIFGISVIGAITSVVGLMISARVFTSAGELMSHHDEDDFALLVRSGHYGFKFAAAIAACLVLGAFFRPTSTMRIFGYIMGSFGDFLGILVRRRED